MPDARLIELQQAAGAVLADGTGWSPRALHFGDARAEYAAAKEQCVLFELSDRTQIELTGADRATYLHNFCTNDIKQLSPGEGCEAFIVDVKAHVLAHVFVFVGEDSIWIDTVPEAEEALLAHLDKYLITEDVELHARSGEWAELFVTGPNASALCKALWTEDLNKDQHKKIEVLSSPASLRRVDWFKHPGYQIRLPKAILADAWYVLSNNEFCPAGDEAFQSLRMESTFPLYGVDITTDNLAQEVGRTSECISFTKGCYLGQEPIARIDAMGHVNRELRGLHLDSKTPPVAGANILDEDDKTVGQVTSAAHSLGEEDAIALGYVRRSHLATGTNVRIEMADGPVAAQVFHRDGD